MSVVHPSETEIRSGLKSGSLTPDVALPLVNAALRHDDVASLHVLRGILILLSDSADVELDDARKAFERAIEISPDRPEAYEELGHYFDAVMRDREKAK